MGTISTSAESGYAAGANAVGPTVYADLQTIVAEFNGNIETVNIADDAITTALINNDAVNNNKIIADSVRQSQATYTTTNSGMLVAQAGPNYSAGGGGVRIARVSKSVEWDDDGSNDVTFTYENDCVDGNPGFYSTPTLLGMPIVASVETVNDTIATAFVTASSKTAISFTFTEQVTSSAVVQIEFGVMGPIA